VRVLCSHLLIRVARGQALPFPDQAHGDVVRRHERRHAILLRQVQHVEHPTFEVEAVAHDEVGVVQPFDVLGRRLPLMRIGAVGDQHDHVGVVAHGVADQRPEHRVGDDDGRAITAVGTVAR